MRSLLASVLCLTVPPAVDLALPGTKLVRNEVVVEWAQELDTHVFVAQPSRAPGGAHRIVRGEPLPHISAPFVPRIHALPRDVVAWPEDREGWDAAGWPSAGLPVQLRNTVAAVSPVVRIRTVIRVAAVGPASLDLVVVSQQELDADGNEVHASAWVVPLAAALAGALGLLWLVRSRRRLVQG